MNGTGQRGEKVPAIDAGRDADVLHVKGGCERMDRHVLASCAEIIPDVAQHFLTEPDLDGLVPILIQPGNVRLMR
jgi:hypothetical protein